MKIDYKSYKLNNGMKIILIPSDTTYSATITALIKSGSVHENEDNQGITHFVEHISLTSTKKYTNKEELNKIAEWNGATFNASTGIDTLRYYVTVPYNKIEYGLDFIYQAVYKTNFVSKYIETERTVILDEISKNNDNVYYGLSRFYLTELSSYNNYKLPIIGTEKNVQKFSLAEIKSHQKFAHDPSKVTLVVVGNFKVDQVKKIIDKSYLKEHSHNPVIPEPQFAIRPGITVAKFDPKTDLIITSLSSKGMPNFGLDPIKDILSGIASSILCGPTTSRLYSRLREKEGLLYGLNRNSIIYNHYGVSEVYFEQKPELYKKTISIIFEELDRYYQKGIKSDELEHYKEYIINRNLVRFDDVYALSKLIVNPIYTGQKVYTLEELNQYIRDITVDQINGFIGEYSNPKDVSVVCYGNTSDSLVDIIKEVKEKICP